MSSEKVEKDLETTKELITARAAVKKKLRDLRQGHFEQEEASKRAFQPIIEPLQELVKRKRTKRVKEERDEYEDEDEEPLDDAPASPPLPPVEDEDEDEQEVEAEDDPEDIVDDSTFGPRRRGNKIQLGNKLYGVDEEAIVVGRRLYRRTPGLLELIQRKEPDESRITAKDRKEYRQILEYTSVYRHSYQPTGRKRSNVGHKWMNVIKPLLERYPTAPETPPTATGQGLKKKKKRTILCDCPDISAPPPNISDPNAICDRLRLLVASREAGHTGHHVEIDALIGRLRADGYIL